MQKGYVSPEPTLEDGFEGVYCVGGSTHDDFKLWAIAYGRREPDSDTDMEEVERIKTILRENNRI